MGNFVDDAVRIACLRQALTCLEEARAKTSAEDADLDNALKYTRRALRSARGDLRESGAGFVDDMDPFR